MRSVAATDAKQDLAAILDTAQQEPIVIRRHDRDVAVLLSTQEYARLQGLNAAEFQHVCDGIAAKVAKRGMKSSVLSKLLSDTAK